MIKILVKQKKIVLKVLRKIKQKQLIKLLKLDLLKSLHLNYQLATFQVFQLQNIEKAGNVFGEERSRVIV